MSTVFMHCQCSVYLNHSLRARGLGELSLSDHVINEAVKRIIIKINTDGHSYFPMNI
jgi:hypothetical protein